MKKIMFNDKYGLTKAVLEGRKTMTRRIVPEKVLEAYYDYDDFVNAVAPRDIPYTREWEEGFFLRYARYEVGEVVAVAQSYNDIVSSEMYADEVLVEEMHLNDEPGWNNKMFVRADLMPHQIRITKVRVERLQDISEEDCLREGVCRKIDAHKNPTRFCGFKGTQKLWSSPREAFAALIDKVSGRGTWDSNPWVFVYEFELVK